jgi:hypothetical protein
MAPAAAPLLSCKCGAGAPLVTAGLGGGSCPAAVSPCSAHSSERCRAPARDGRGALRAEIISIYSPSASSLLSTRGSRPTSGEAAGHEHVVRPYVHVRVCVYLPFTAAFYACAQAHILRYRARASALGQTPRCPSVAC